MSPRELSLGRGEGGDKQCSGGIEDFPLYGSDFGIFRPEYSSYFGVSYFMYGDRVTECSVPDHTNMCDARFRLLYVVFMLRCRTDNPERERE